MSFPYFALRFVRTLNLDIAPPRPEPLPRWPFIFRALDGLATGEDLHVEKSRQLLLSWLCASAFSHDLLFRPYSSGVMMSREAGLVDDGGERSTPNSLLGKVRFIVENLPGWFAPVREKVRFKYMQALNEAANASVAGKATTEHPGRGPSFTRALVDEAAFVPRSESVLQSLRFSCPRGIILCSSPHGRRNVHARIRFATGPTTFQRLRFYWREHPHRDDAWFNRITASMLPTAIAQELELNYADSVGGLVMPLDGDRIGSFPFDPALPLIGSWDFGMADLTVCVLWQRYPTRDRIVDCIRGRSREAADYDRELREAYPMGTLREWADPSGSARNSEGTSWIATLRDRCRRPIAGVEPLEWEENGEEVRRRNEIVEIGHMRANLLPRLEVNVDTPGGAAVADALQGWHFPTDDEDKPTSYVPVHDEDSHYGDAVKYFDMGEHGSTRPFDFSRFEQTAAASDIQPVMRGYDEQGADDDDFGSRFPGEP